MNIKTAIFSASLAGITMTVSGAEREVSTSVPEVKSVTMSQSVDRRVTVTYTMDNAPAVVTLDIQTNCIVNGEMKWTSIGGQAICNAKGAVWRKVTEDDAIDGVYTITWRPDLSWPDHKIAAGGARAVVTAWALDNTPDYMVVDLSASAEAGSQNYYPSADFLPGGLLGNPDYRTTSLVMRKIMAKDITWTMGSTALETLRQAKNEMTHQVTLTNNYYIGVFEVTQGQWSLIQTASTNPSKYNNPAYRAMRPVEQVSYNEIRNSVNLNADTAFDWPAEPNPASFLGLLRAKTEIDFDLPSDAQWEYACRAGNGDTTWGDGSGILNIDQDENLERMARTQYNGGRVKGVSGGYSNAPANCDLSLGTAHVGSYEPNSWGLYDMHGNVWEWCLDWSEDNIATAKDASGEYYNGRVNIDPSNSQALLSGSSQHSNVRIIRGGTHYLGADVCRSAHRNVSTAHTRSFAIGFRVVCTAGLK